MAVSRDAFYPGTHLKDTGARGKRKTDTVNQHFYSFIEINVMFLFYFIDTALVVFIDLKTQSL